MKKTILSLFIFCALALTASAQLTVTISSHLLDQNGFPVPDGPTVLSIYTLSGTPEDLYGDGSTYIWNDAHLSFSIGGSFSYHSDLISAGFASLPGAYGFEAFGLDQAIFQERLLSSDPAVMSNGLLTSYLDADVFDNPGGMYVGDEIYAWAPDYYFIEGTWPSLPTSAVPEPSTYGLIGAGALTALILVRRRTRRA